MMPSPSLQTLQNLAADTGHQPDTLEKVLRLIDLLQEIADDPVLAGNLALKGGTALNVFYFNLDRLSVDIDLNFVGALARDEMLAKRDALEAAMGRILAAAGYQVRRQPTEHAGGKWIAAYASALGGRQSLEIDINFMMRSPLFGVARMDSVRLGDRQAKGVFVVERHEVIAGKLVALLDRRAARDLFDAERIFALPDVNWKWVRAAMLAIGAAGRNDWRKVSAGAIAADRREFKQKLAVCLPRGRFGDDAAIDAWIKQTIALCRQRAGALIDYTESERAFLKGVLEQGEIKADLLDVGPEIQMHIAAMPMLIWKAQNVRRAKDGA
jgi:predicted nucleotidyltransferase component of viral defense system